VEKTGRVVWLPSGPGEDTKRYARTRLTHIAPTFGPGMDRPDLCCLFGSGRWDAIYPFFCPCGRFRTQADRLGRPAGDALRLGGVWGFCLRRRAAGCEIVGALLRTLVGVAGPGLFQAEN
jgi:hypothetical protein